MYGSGGPLRIRAPTRGSWTFVAVRETLLVERDAGVVTITLNRPRKLNAMTARMWQELIEALDEIEDNRDDRALIITGAGDGFCSGADLTDTEGNETAVGGVGGTWRRMRLVGSAALKLHDFAKPTVAAVNGVAAGAGLNLALCCDIIVASDRARFSEIFSRRGLAVDYGGSWLLPRLIGLHRAKELVLLAEMLDATAAERMGLVNRVVAHDALITEVREIAGRLAALPPLQLAMSKKLLNQSFAMSMAEALDAEGLAQTVSFASKDTIEAVLAFAQKREPHFTGE